jgi:uncharacterized protein (DUF1778 family)
MKAANRKTTTGGKAANLMVRLDPGGKKLVQRVASLRGVSTSDYVRSVVLAHARRDLVEAERSVIALSAADQLAFWRALHEPVALTPAQRRLGRIMRGKE